MWLYYIQSMLELICLKHLFIQTLLLECAGGLCSPVSWGVSEEREKTRTEENKKNETSDAIPIGK